MTQTATENTAQITAVIATPTTQRPRRTSHFAASDGAAQANESDPGMTKKGLFSDLSFASIIGSALAAVTSMLLSSKIGIAGSVIGVAVASVVTTVTTQVYKRALAASAEGLKRLASDDTQGRHHEPMHAKTAPETHSPAMSRAEVVQEAGQRRAHSSKRSIILFAIGIGLATALVTAGLINFATAGNGIGAKTEPIFVTATVEDTEAADAEAIPATEDEAAQDTAAVATTDVAAADTDTATTDTEAAEDGAATDTEAVTGDTPAEDTGSTVTDDTANAGQGTSGTTPSDGASSPTSGAAGAA